jgi:hypothetical protein
LRLFIVVVPSGPCTQLEAHSRATSCDVLNLDMDMTFSVIHGGGHPDGGHPDLVTDEDGT